MKVITTGQERRLVSTCVEHKSRRFASSTLSCLPPPLWILAFLFLVATRTFGRSWNFVDDGAGGRWNRVVCQPQWSWGGAASSRRRRRWNFVSIGLAVDNCHHRHAGEVTRKVVHRSNANRKVQLVDTASRIARPTNECNIKVPTQIHILIQIWIRA